MAPERQDCPSDARAASSDATVQPLEHTGETPLAIADTIGPLDIVTQIN
jgi:hypothetical protein